MISNFKYKWVYTSLCLFCKRAYSRYAIRLFHRRWYGFIENEVSLNLWLCPNGCALTSFLAVLSDCFVLLLLSPAYLAWYWVQYCLTISWQCFFCCVALVSSSVSSVWHCLAFAMSNVCPNNLKHWNFKQKNATYFLALNLLQCMFSFFCLITVYFLCSPALASRVVGGWDRLSFCDRDPPKWY